MWIDVWLNYVDLVESVVFFKGCKGLSMKGSFL